MSWFSWTASHLKTEQECRAWNRDTRSKELWKGIWDYAIKVVLWVGFNILGLESVYLSTFPMNERGQKAFKSAGFKEAGVRRRGYFTMGEFRDIIIMDILKEEFFE